MHKSLKLIPLEYNFHVCMPRYKETKFLFFFCIFKLEVALEVSETIAVGLVTILILRAILDKIKIKFLLQDVILTVLLPGI